MLNICASCRVTRSHDPKSGTLHIGMFEPSNGCWVTSECVLADIELKKIMFVDDTRTDRLIRTSNKNDLLSSLADSGPSVWNYLPTTLSSSPNTVRQFQSGMKTKLSFGILGINRCFRDCLGR